MDNNEKYILNINIRGLIDKKFISPFTFQGGCNAEVFNIWLENILFPNLPLGATIVLDNAARINTILHS